MIPGAECADCGEDTSREDARVCPGCNEVFHVECTTPCATCNGAFCADCIDYLCDTADEPAGDYWCKKCQGGAT